MQKLYNFLYRRAQGIIVIGQDMANRILDDCPQLAGKIDLIRNWADAEAIAPEAVSANALVRQLRLDDKFIIQFSGNIGRTHGAEILIEAAELLRDEPGIHFLIIGNGAKRICLEGEVVKRCLANITFADYQPRESLSSTLCACHVALVTMAPGMLGLSVPSRSYNIMAAGRPMIAVAENDSEVATMVSKLNTGWVVKPGCAQDLANAIRDARNSPDLLAAMSTRARNAATTEYERGKTLHQYTKALTRFLAT
jgi:glycosyltransferase involved in cell wall biosynthesis